MRLRFVLKVCSAVSLCIVGGENAAGRIESRQDASTMVNSGEERNLGVKMWTWNALGADMAEAARELLNEAYSQPEVKVVVACQTEASIPILDYVDRSKWLLLSHGEHWGWTKMTSNAQMLTVLYRQTGDQSLRSAPYVGTRDDWKLPGKGLKGFIKSDYLMPQVHIQNVVTASSNIHITSRTGKGGVSSLLQFQETQSWPKTSVAVVCAHLDSEKETSRDEGFAKLIAGSMRREGLYVESPQELFDHAAYSSPQVDALFVLGDLNYRIRYADAAYPYDITNDAQMAELYAGSERKTMAIDDPLNPNGAKPNSFVLDAADGFGLECNQPHRKYLPTYRRFDTDACLKLNDALSRRPSGSLTKEMQDLTKKCFVGSLESEWKLKEKNRFLQVGWLDRFCWRAVTDSILSIKLEDERGWHHISGSDHVPVSATLRLSSRPTDTASRQSAAIFHGSTARQATTPSPTAQPTTATTRTTTTTVTTATTATTVTTATTATFATTVTIATTATTTTTATSTTTMTTATTTTAPATATTTTTIVPTTTSTTTSGVAPIATEVQDSTTLLKVSRRKRPLVHPLPLRTTDFILGIGVAACFAYIALFSLRRRYQERRQANRALAANENRLELMRIM
eukprot:TRINITY_DN13076_c0_g1_i2.p1 TRINITY_DN13076_c0_g1~~TRINITY_DN13076_c0_g1_i2.p1  ORF type:complete len:627 (-),score=39.47 TRINITY_DN13076_c0_g1_i2:46-1926(-)